MADPLPDVTFPVSAGLGPACGSPWLSHFLLTVYIVMYERYAVDIVHAAVAAA